MKRTDADAPTGHLSWVWKIWKEKPRLVVLMLALSLVSSAVAVAFPYLYKVLLDGLQARLEAGGTDAGASREAMRIAGLVLVVGAGSFVSSLFPGIRAATNVAFDYLLRRKFFGIVLGRSMRFVSSFRTGDLVTRLTDDVSADGRLSWFLCSGIFRAVEAIAKIVFCLAAMFAMDWKLTLFSMIPLPFMIGIFWYAQEKIQDTFKRNQEAVSDVNSQLEMSFSGARVIKASVCEAKYGRFFASALARRAGTEYALARLDAVLILLYQYIDYFAQIALVFAGGLAAARGELGIGTFYAFYNYLGMLVFPILDIPQLFISGKRSFVNIDRLEELRGESPADPVAAVATAAGATADPGAREAPETRRAEPGTLCVRGLSFTYPGAPAPALDGVDFELPPGARLAVLGPVGSGKSTLLKILCGVLEADSGTVGLADGDGKVGNAAGLAALLGYVPQEASLFSGTVRENIAFGSPGDGTEIRDGELENALRISQMDLEVSRMPAGAETRLGQRGTAVSGGQRQRLAIARAIARSPRILLLDDITASLDAANEERLMTALSDWSKDLSCVVVSHRLSTVQFAGTVLYMEGGRMKGFGTHSDLMAGNRAYRVFIESQEAPTEKISPGQRPEAS